MRTEHLDRARDLFPLIDEAAGKSQGMPLSSDVVEAMRDAGLFGVMVPEAVGGTELPITDVMDVWAEISRADGSAGWCLMASAAATAYFGAWCGPDLTDVMFADGVPISAGQFAPNGTAKVVGDTYVLNGKYNFGSGANHAEWMGAGVITEVAEGENPDYLFCIYPAAEAQLDGNWNVLGLQATASYDYHIDDVTIPAANTFNFFSATRHNGGPVYDLGVMVLTCAGHAAFALGVVRRALDEAIAIAQTKQRMGHASKLGESEHYLMQLGALESRYRAGKAWLYNTFAAAEAYVTEHGEPSPTLANECKQATTWVTQDGADVVRSAYLMTGTTALRDGALQRAFRDIHAGTQHVLGSGGTKEFAQDLLNS